MNTNISHNGVAPPTWLQRYLPWLGLFTLVMSLAGDNAGIGFDPDELNG